MDRVPISFYEKVEARMTRRGKGACWPWNGNVNEGRPALNQHDVMRLIYEQERGPIPPGMALFRTDHTDVCRWTQTCSHLVCVNPWHVEVRPRVWRGAPLIHDQQGTEFNKQLQRTIRANRRKREQKNDGNRDSQGVLDAGTGGSGEGLRMEEPDERQSDRERDSDRGRGESEGV